jgi:putative transposase
VKLSFRFRIKDATVGRHLSRHAWASNQVWNYCCSIQREAARRRRGGSSCSWPTAFDLINLCAASSKLLGLNASTISSICRQFAVSRDAHGGCPRFRSSRGPRRSLGWVPFGGRYVQVDGDSIFYLKRRFRFWKSQDIQGVLKAGCFTQDARGRWYVVLQCEVDTSLPTGSGEVGIDLGLKTTATLSDGTVVPALRLYRRYQDALAIQARAGNRRRVRAIYAKIANARRHQLHEASARIASANSLIVVGNVSPSKLAKTKMAKSVFDAGWTILRSQLRYKASRHGAVYLEVDERFTSQTCSACGCIPASSPKGRGALGIRRWECCGCGAVHDRDVNAATNILIAGAERRPPAAEIQPAIGRRYSDSAVSQNKVQA